jgi:hypothetical protein
LIPDRYAAAVRDEIWIGGARVESRVSFGEAVHDGASIVAVDRPTDSALREMCEGETARVRDIVREIGDARVRIVVRATSDEPLTSTLVITIGNVSIVTTPQFALGDVSKLRKTVGAVPHVGPPVVNDLPLAWHNGTAAILLHEAVGHAREHEHADVQWPRWLDVKINYAMRRETFRDVPLLRMTEVVVAQKSAPFEMPAKRIDIEYVAGGSYEPLTGMVTIDVAVPPMRLQATRSQIAASFFGASGEPLRYPGVICSREGQELYVPSSAPLVITGPLA